MLINGGLGEIRQFTPHEYGYDDDREYESGSRALSRVERSRSAVGERR